MFAKGIGEFGLGYIKMFFWTLNVSFGWMWHTATNTPTFQNLFELILNGFFWSVVFFTPIAIVWRLTKLVAKRVRKWI